MSYRDKLVDLSDGEKENLSKSFEEFYRIVKTLRAPHGCPWDKKQTPESLSPNLLEEVYELIDAIENKDLENTREELGDIFLVATMISYMYAQQHEFALSEVLDEISAKLVRRHPHVFGDIVKEDADEVLELWNHIKKNVEKKGTEAESIFDSIPRTMPPLERAYKIQKKAAKIGFDWDSIDDVFGKLHEEINELKEQLHNTGLHSPDTDAVENEVGDVLFSIINLARFLKTDPALALNKTNKKFLRRFSHIEQSMQEKQKELSKDNFQEMDALWEEAKRLEHN